MDSRPDPDALLRRVQREAGPLERREGRLKVFLGASPGVGKTFEMLREALDQQAQGVDVVAGYVEPHGRAETEGMLAGLDVLPFREVEYRGITLREFDIDAVRARRPTLVLIDELAHTNAEGSRHRKRWQDVLELIRHGIDVYTTVNVQHVESLRDVVASITGIVPQETVPDAVFTRADRIELVDVPPEELLARLAAGKIYVPERAAEAAARFFRPGTLSALRQIALRFVADHVDRGMEVYRRAEAVPQTWAARDRLLVCIGGDRAARPLVRAAKRMADRLSAPWTVVHVEPTTGLSAGARALVDDAFALAASFDARTVTLVSDRPVDDILRLAREDNATRLIAGPPSHAPWRDRLLGRSFLDALVRGAGGGLDVLVTSGAADAESPPPTPSVRAPWLDYAAAAAAIAVVVAATEAFLDFELVNVAMLLLGAVVLVATRLGRGPTTLATVLALGAFDFFFVPPRYTFVIDAEYAVTFAVMSAVAALVAGLTLRARASADAARARERRTDALFRLGRDLVAVTRTADVLKRGVGHLAQAFGAHTVAMLPDESGKLVSVIAQGGSPRLAAKEEAVAAWVFANGLPAGRGAATLPAADGHYVPVSAGGRTLGVIGFFGDGAWTPDRATQVEAFTNPIALALLRSDLSAWLGAG